MEREKSTSRGQFIPSIAAASGAGSSGACLPSGAWSWLDPSLARVTLPAAGAQAAQRMLHCHPVSKTVSADSLTSVFLQVFPVEDFSCAFSGRAKDQKDSLCLPWCCCAACFLQDTGRESLVPWLSLSSSGRRWQQDGPTYPNNCDVSGVLCVTKMYGEIRWAVMRPETVPKRERSGNVCTIGRTIL